MPEAQPGQEQRMVTDAMIEAAAKALWKADRYGYQNDSTDGPQSFDDHDTNGKANYREMARAALEAARPTADLGEDGELVDRIATMLERQRRNRYAEEAVAGDARLVDTEDAREIVHEVLHTLRAVLSRSGG